MREMLTWKITFKDLRSNDCNSLVDKFYSLGPWSSPLIIQWYIIGYSDGAEFTKYFVARGTICRCKVNISYLRTLSKNFWGIISDFRCFILYYAKDWPFAIIMNARSGKKTVLLDSILGGGSECKIEMLYNVKIKSIIAHQNRSCTDAMGAFL